MVKLTKEFYEERLKACSTISRPMASRKETKAVHRLVKKATKTKVARRGIKEVTKALNKKIKGIVVIAGDIQPIDVVTHMAIVCEDSETPYIYVPSKADLGLAATCKRPTSCVMVSKPNKDPEKWEGNDLFTAVKKACQKQWEAQIPPLTGS